MHALSPTADVNTVVYPQLEDYSQWDPTPTVQAILAMQPDHIIFYNDNADDVGLLTQELQIAHYTGGLAQSSEGARPANLSAAGLGGYRGLIAEVRSVDTPEYQAHSKASEQCNGQTPHSTTFKCRPSTPPCKSCWQQRVQAQAGWPAAPPCAMQCTK